MRVRYPDRGGATRPIGLSQTSLAGKTWRMQISMWAHPFSISRILRRKSASSSLRSFGIAWSPPPFRLLRSSRTSCAAGVRSTGATGWVPCGRIRRGMISCFSTAILPTSRGLAVGRHLGVRVDLMLVSIAHNDESSLRPAPNLQLVVRRTLPRPFSAWHRPFVWPSFKPR